GWQICAPIIYAPLPSIAIPGGGVVRLHLGATGQDSATNFFFPLFRDLSTQDSFVLFKSANFLNAADIVDFVSWGGGTQRIGQAVSVGQWPSATATVPLPKTEGRTIAWRGKGDSNLDWYRDATPTIGRTNGISTISPLGKGCRLSNGIPTLSFPSPAVDGNLDFKHRVIGGPANTLVVYLLGSKPTGGIPILGCSLELLPDILTLTLPVKEFSLPLFLKGSKLTGLQLYFPAAVFDPQAPNGILGMTSAAKISIG
ncbi:MAG: hypothetical protein ACE5F1_06495, partial [Planctomycetota bacterium]